MPGGELVSDGRAMFDAYASRWLLLDLVSVAPWDVLVAALAASRGHAPAALMLKVAKLPRLLRLRTLASGSQHRLGTTSALARVGQLMASFLILAHWGACAMWSISRVQVEYAPDNGRTQTGLMPMALVDHRHGVTYSPAQDMVQAAVRGAAAAQLPSRRSRHRAGGPPPFRPPSQLCMSRTLPGLILPPGSEWTLYCADLKTKYVAMAYYALTTLCTIGFGDFVPGTNMERYCAIFLELFGCVACAVVFGNMAMLLHTFDQAGSRLISRLQRLQRLCSHYRVPRELALRAEHMNSELWRMQRGLDMEAVWEAVPRNLYAPVLMHLYGDALRSSPLLQEAPERLMMALAQRMQPAACCQGDTLGGPRNPLPALLFVRAGRLTLRRGGKTLRTLVTGDTFGEEVLVGSGGGGGEGGGGLLHLRCEDKGHLLFLPVQDLEEVLQAMPDARALLREKAMKLVGERRGGEKGAGAEAAEEDTPFDGLLALDARAPGSALALRLVRMRRAAAVQQRVVGSRLTAALASYAALETEIQGALDGAEEASRDAWLGG